MSYVLFSCKSWFFFFWETLTIPMLRWWWKCWSFESDCNICFIFHLYRHPLVTDKTYSFLNYIHPRAVNIHIIHKVKNRLVFIVFVILDSHPTWIWVCFFCVYVFRLNITNMSCISLARFRVSDAYSCLRLTELTHTKRTAVNTSSTVVVYNNIFVICIPFNPFI